MRNYLARCLSLSKTDMGCDKLSPREGCSYDDA